VYPTSEHLYQARKFLYSGSPDINAVYAEEIRLASTPYKAKILANQRIVTRYSWQKELSAIISRFRELGVKCDPNWEEKKLEVMKEVLFLKFCSNKHCRVVLASTEGHQLVEHTSTDKFWADGGGDEKGLNWLGRLLVQTRQQLLNHE